MPTNVAAIKSMVDQNTTEVRWRGGGYGYRGVGYRGGGYGYRGGLGYRGVGYRSYGYRGYGYRGLGYGVAAGAIVGGAIARRSYYGYSGGYGYSSGYPSYSYAFRPAVRLRRLWRDFMAMAMATAIPPTATRPSRSTATAAAMAMAAPIARPVAAMPPQAITAGESVGASFRLRLEENGAAMQRPACRGDDAPAGRAAEFHCIAPLCGIRTIAVSSAADRGSRANRATQFAETAAMDDGRFIGAPAGAVHLCIRGFLGFRPARPPIAKSSARWMSRTNMR